MRRERRPLERTLISSRDRELEFRRRRLPGESASAPSLNGNGDSAGTGPAPRRYLPEYARWLWPYRMAILWLFLLAMGGSALDVLWPLSIKGIIDLLASSRPAMQKFQLLIGYAGHVIPTEICTAA